MTTAEQGSDSIPSVNSIFEQPWWLDVVAPGRWSAAEVRRDDKVVARLPYVQRRRLGLNTIGLMLTCRSDLEDTVRLVLGTVRSVVPRPGRTGVTSAG